MLPEPSTLVRLVMETLGTKGPTALARELGMRDYGAPRKIGDWLDGKYAPNYEATMLMLNRAGFLNLQANTPRRAALALAPLSARQRYLLAAEGDDVTAQELASIFNTTEEEIQAELETAREEFAKWEEIHGEEVRMFTPDSPTQALAQRTGDEDPPGGGFVPLRLGGGEAASDSPGNPMLNPLTFLFSSNAELTKRVESLEEEIRALRTETA